MTVPTSVLLLVAKDIYDEAVESFGKHEDDDPWMQSAVRAIEVRVHEELPTGHWALFDGSDLVRAGNGFEAFRA